MFSWLKKILVEAPRQRQWMPNQLSARHPELQQALRDQGDGLGVALLIASDTSFSRAVPIDQLTDEEVIVAIHSVPTHY